MLFYLHAGVTSFLVPAELEYNLWKLTYDTRDWVVGISPLAHIWPLGSFSSPKPLQRHPDGPLTPRRSGIWSSGGVFSVKTQHPVRNLGNTVWTPLPQAWIFLSLYLFVLALRDLLHVDSAIIWHAECQKHLSHVARCRRKDRDVQHTTVTNSRLDRRVGWLWSEEAPTMTRQGHAPWLLSPPSLLWDWLSSCSGYTIVYPPPANWTVQITSLWLPW